MTDKNKDTPTRRYDLMQMRVEEIQGLVTILQQRRITANNAATLARTNSKVQKSADEQLTIIMNKLEKRIARMLKDDADTTQMLNDARALLFEVSDGEVRLGKTAQMEKK